MKSIFLFLIFLLIASCTKGNKQEQTMNIELYYFESCPSYIETAENLKKALHELGANEDFKMIEVIDSQDAIKKKFLGSPSIRINGTDIENKDRNYIYGCRIYAIAGKMTGTPSKEFLKEKLQSFIKK
jgi:hypothetical protein